MANNLRVIFYREGEIWLAQGIEHDICVQADSLDDLYGRFEVAVRLECDKEGKLDHIGEAPSHFKKMWDRKSGDFTPSFMTDRRYEVGLAA